MPPRLAPTAALAIVACVVACATSPGTPPVSRDPTFDDARACLASATWIDRVEGPIAVAVGPDGAARALPLAELAFGTHEGSAILDGVPSPRCEARIRAYVRALRGVNAKAGDTSNAVRLQ